MQREQSRTRNHGFTPKNPKKSWFCSGLTNVCLLFEPSHSHTMILMLWTKETQSWHEVFWQRKLLELIHLQTINVVISILKEKVTIMGFFLDFYMMLNFLLQVIMFNQSNSLLDGIEILWAGLGTWLTVRNTFYISTWAVNVYFGLNKIRFKIKCIMFRQEAYVIFSG